MNDPRETFERDLKARLAIDPSPNLQASIRARAFSAPVKRTPWLALTSGLAAATAAIILLVIYIQPTSPENIPPSHEVAARVPVPSSTATAPLTTPSPAAIRPAKSRIPSGVKQPALGQIQVVADENAGLNSGPIELAPLRGLEITSSLAPLPQTPPLSIVRVEPINIEPLTLTVHNLGVNE